MRTPSPSAWLASLCLAGILTLCIAPAQADGVDVRVLENTANRVVLQYAPQHPTFESVQIDGQKYVNVLLGDESVIKQIGQPELPNVCRSIILPDTGVATIKILKANYYELADMLPAPSKGFLSRTVDPADVPYEFGPAYGQDALFPAKLASLRSPYILRDYRGVVVEVNPLRSNPVTGVMRVYTNIVVEITTSGSGGINELSRGGHSLVDSNFQAIYRHQFVNHDQAHRRYDPIDEQGDMLIICHDAWLANVQPLVDHKNARGIPTTAVGVSTIGNNSTAIKDYIQSVYDSSDLAYVLLVGDDAQVATPNASGGASDPSYSKLAGSDNYPDIIVGRFSAETAAHVDTQVQRTITYETMPAPLQDWFWRGVGIASTQGAGQGDEGQADNVHMDEIRDWLLAYDYTLIDQIYDPSGTAAQVAAAVNDGRGIINYCGHGSTTSWSTTGFSSSDVNALVNNNMLPFICSVACVNGQFDGYTCFGEAWLRATNGGTPTGAIGAYMSSINQSWAPPMEGQDEFNLLIVAEAYASYGALCFAGSCSMMDDYGDGGVSMFDTWHIFGDPSVRIGVSCVDAGTISLDSDMYACEGTLGILVVDCGLNLDDNIVEQTTITVVSDSEPAGESVVLTELGPASGQFAGTLAVSATDSGGVLLVADGDAIVATYIDEDDGQGGTNIVVTAEAAVDCAGPVISDVVVLDVQPRDATIGFQANEPVQGIVYYGLSCDNLPWTATGGGFDTSPTVVISGLQDSTTYYFMVAAVDVAGNLTEDDECYNFTTPEVPDFFTEIFESDDNDLTNLRLLFTPSGTVDYYQGCTEPITELPVDPSGHTQLTLSDDDNQQVTLSGATVSLYGDTYSSFFVGSNGYITFDHGETGYTETLTNHFGTPRIAGLFDDLNPANGGTISWSQLADRVVVTYEGVPEYSNTGANTFQIEMFFDGRIAISYLSVSATDGLAGLSAGEGLDPDYFESDLSNMGSCGPRPPMAASSEVTTPIGEQVLLPLQATDDGLPNPPGALTYFVIALPEHGYVTDAWCGPIESVPHEVCDPNSLWYHPDAGYNGPDSLQFLANDGGTPPDGGDSNIATVSIIVGGPGVVMEFPLDSDPGWETTGQWAFGQPTGQGGTAHGNPDPTSGATGSNVYGVNLDGDYDTTPGGPYYVTLGPLDLSDVTEVELHFERWLNSDYQPYAINTVEVSTNGTDWQTLWINSSGPNDASWLHIELPAPMADNQADVSFRWGYEIGAGAYAFSGWNIDDIVIWGLAPTSGLPGDLNCDGAVDFDDIDAFVLALSGEEAYYAEYPDCNWFNADCNGDGGVGFDDIDAFVALLGG